MASSRWKRFAFFERHSYNVPKEVLEDLKGGDISLHVAPATLPSMETTTETDALAAMLSSLNACQALPVNHIPLPSQEESIVKQEPQLMLCWVASSHSNFVHCIDITLRCHSSAADIEMDGWRGYFEPLSEGVRDIAVTTNKLVCVGATTICVWDNPHYHLHCRRPLTSQPSPDAQVHRLAGGSDEWTCVSMSIDKIAAGTATGHVVVWTHEMRVLLRISPPSASLCLKVYLQPNNMVVCAYEEGLSCFEVHPNNSSVRARHDLDGRRLESRSLCDANDEQIVVSRKDGLYLYSAQGGRQSVTAMAQGRSASCVGHFLLVASTTDPKSGRDAVDIYDTVHQLVAFHLLLPPNHVAWQSCGLVLDQRSCGLILTSGGTLVTLLERSTKDKVELLVSKHLYAAAIGVADKQDVMELIQQYAQFLYTKGDFGAAMDQYILTIGALESFVVIFRYLDAPKIPHLVRYLQALREQNLATTLHLELLKTCHLKLNDTQAANSIPVSDMEWNAQLLQTNPKQAMATIAVLEPDQAARVLQHHGTALARALPRETMGCMLALAMGTFTKLALFQSVDVLSQQVEVERTHEPFAISLFANALVEHPKLQRILLQTCQVQKCPLTLGLRKTLLELTLREWNQAQRTGDTKVQAMRHREAVAALATQAIPDMDALVICKLAGFADGELILYERMPHVPLLLERYAQDGSETSRRKMLALGQGDPQVLAQVLGLLVQMAHPLVEKNEDEDEVQDILDDISECLTVAARQGVLTPIRLARILAGDGSGQSEDSNIPLSVAMDYVCQVLSDYRQETQRLQLKVQELQGLCEDLEGKIRDLRPEDHVDDNDVPGLIREMQTKLAQEELASPPQLQEAFWREMETEDGFSTIARYFAKGVIP